MPIQDETGRTDGSADGGRADQAPVSRRSVLRGAAMAGVTGIAASALAGVAGAAAEAAPSGAAQTPNASPDHADQIVVHIRDVRSGQMDVLRGTSQTRLHDPEIVARLARASRS